MKKSGASFPVIFSLMGIFALAALTCGGCLVVKHDHGLHKGQYKQMEKGKGRK